MSENAEQLSYLDFVSPCESHGSPYPCSQARIDKTMKPRHHRDHQPSVDTAEAVSEVVKHNTKRPREIGPSEFDAIQRVCDLFSLISSEPDSLGPDLLYKTFSDLDKIFYGGQLFRNVQVRWKTEAFFCSDPGGKIYGLTKATEGTEKRAEIYMNAHMFSIEGAKESVVQMLATVLHEMAVSPGNRWLTLLRYGLT